MTSYPKRIEIVTGVIIENDLGQIFLTKSKYWLNKYVLPGGLINPGETIFEATKRKIKSDLNLEVQPIATFNFGELIDSNDFKRSAHYIYFNVHCKIVSGKPTVDQSKYFDYLWLNPKESLKLNLAESFDNSILKFIEYLKTVKK